MQDVVVRERRPADMGACVAVLRQVHDADGYPLNWPRDPQRWLTASALLQAWVAESPPGVIVGHVALHGVHADPDAAEASEPPAAELSRLYVAPAARRRSVATALMNTAIGWATSHDLRLTLNVTDERRSAAIAFYEASGWRHTHDAAADWTTPAGDAVTLRHYSPPRRDH